MPSLDSRDIKGAFVNLEKYKPRNYNPMDYSDVTHERKSLKSKAVNGSPTSAGANNLRGV